jgi:hypothetical protein
LPVLLILAISVAAPPPALAQFAQYTPAGGPGEFPEDRKMSFEDAVENARWRLGPIRADPWIGIRDVGWLSNTAKGERDFSATAGAGLRTYLPTGPKSLLAAHVLPEYVWYSAASERNRLNGRYGAGFFGFFNRLTASLTATREQALGIVTAQIPERVNTRSDEAAAALELRVQGSLYLFTEASESRIRSLADDERDASARASTALDRDETILRAGLRWRTRGGWLVGIGVEESEVDFLAGRNDRSNSGTAPILEVLKEEGRTVLGLELAFRSLEPEGDATFLPYDGVTGSFRIGRRGGRLEGTLYGSRGLIYALDLPFSYYEDDRLGISFATSLGRRTSVGGFVEAGVNDYQAVSPDIDRSDEVAAYGLNVTMPCYSSLRLTVGYYNEEYTSDLPGADRTITAIHAGITLGAGPSPWY